MDPQPTDAPEPAQPAPRALKDIQIVSGRRSGRLARQAAFGRIAVGSVLGRTFSIYGRSFLPLAVMSLLVHAPLIAYTMWVYRSEPGSAQEWEEFAGTERTYLLLLQLGTFLLANILAGPVTFNVVERLRGSSPSLGASLRVGFGRIPRILLTVLLFAMYLFVLAFVGAFVMAIPMALLLGAMGREAGAVAGGFLMLGVVYLVMSVFWVAVPAAVVEDVGPREALGRSSRLTKRNVWKVFAVVLVLAVMNIGLHKVILGLAGEGFEAVRLVNLSLVMLAALLTGPLGAVAAAIVYHDLRTTMEGVDTETLARVFE